MNGKLSQSSSNSRTEQLCSCTDLLIKGAGHCSKQQNTRKTKVVVQYFIHSKV